MGDNLDYNVKRMFYTNETAMEAGLKPKELGFEGATGKMGVVPETGPMMTFPSNGSDASFNNLNLNKTSGFLTIDSSGDVGTSDITPKVNWTGYANPENMRSTFVAGVYTQYSTGGVVKGYTRGKYFEYLNGDAALTITIPATNNTGVYWFYINDTSMVVEYEVIENTVDVQQNQCLGSGVIYDGVSAGKIFDRWVDVNSNSVISYQNYATGTIEDTHLTSTLTGTHEGYQAGNTKGGYLTSRGFPFDVTAVSQSAKAWSIFYLNGLDDFGEDLINYRSKTNGVTTLNVADVGLSGTTALVYSNYNGSSYDIEPVDDGYCVAIHYFIAKTTGNIFAVTGKEQHETLANAQLALAGEQREISLSAELDHESKLISSAIFLSSDTIAPKQQYVNNNLELFLAAGDEFESDIEVPEDYIDFIPKTVRYSNADGRFFYDDNDKTMMLLNGNDDFINLMNGARILCAGNVEAVTLTKGTVVDIHGISIIGSRLVINMQIADATENANKSDEGWLTAVLTEDTLPGECGIVALYGTLLNVNTAGMTVGTPLFLGSNGTYTNDRPDYPAESILVGAVLVADATNGAIGITTKRDNYDYEFDGCIIEKHETAIGVDGTTVYMDVSNLGDPTRNLPVQLSGTKWQLDTTTGGPARIELLQGISTKPTMQTVYVYNNNGVATLAVTAGVPLVPYAPVSKVSIRDYTTVLANGPDADRRTTSSKAHGGRGRIAYLTERWSIESPKWFTGVTPTATIDKGPSPDTMNLAVIAGIVYQTHSQSMPALSVDTDGIYLANGSGGAGLDNYTKFTDLTDLLGYVSYDIARDTTARGHLVIFAVINKDSSECKLFANLPSDLYGSNNSSAFYDPNSTANYTVPDELRFTAFLVAQIQYRISGNAIDFLSPDGNITSSGEYVKNLLGNPIGVSGGASGGGAYTPSLLPVLQQGSSAGNQPITDLSFLGITGTDDVVNVPDGSWISTPLKDGTESFYFTTDSSPSLPNAGGLIAIEGGSVRLRGNDKSSLIMDDYFTASITNDSLTVSDVLLGSTTSRIKYGATALRLFEDGAFLEVGSKNIQISDTEGVLCSIPTADILTGVDSHIVTNEVVRKAPVTVDFLTADLQEYLDAGYTTIISADVAGIQQTSLTLSANTTFKGIISLPDGLVINANGHDVRFEGVAFTSGNLTITNGVNFVKFAQLDLYGSNLNLTSDVTIQVESLILHEYTLAITNSSFYYQYLERTTGEITESSIDVTDSKQSNWLRPSPVTDNGTDTILTGPNGNLTLGATANLTNVDNDSETRLLFDNTGACVSALDTAESVTSKFCARNGYAEMGVDGHSNFKVEKTTATTTVPIEFNGVTTADTQLPNLAEIMALLMPVKTALTPLGSFTASSSNRAVSVVTLSGGYRYDLQGFIIKSGGITNGDVCFVLPFGYHPTKVISLIVGARTTGESKYNKIAAFNIASGSDATPGEVSVYSDDLIDALNLDSVASWDILD